MDMFSFPLLLAAQGYTDKLLLVLPAALCIIYAICLERSLYHRDMTYLPLWRPAMSMVILLVGRFVWSGWVSNVPMENIILYGTQDATSLKISITVFFVILSGSVFALLYSSAHHIVEETLLGNDNPSLTVLRLSPIVLAVILWIFYLFRCNALVGEHGLLNLILS